MKLRTVMTYTAAAVLTAASFVVLPGCAVSRGQQSVGEFVDDATITTGVKARLLDNREVAGTSVKVETLNGTVMLSGFAKSEREKAVAEDLARSVKGVNSVRNQIVVRP